MILDLNETRNLCFKIFKQIVNSEMRAELYVSRYKQKISIICF